MKCPVCETNYDDHLEKCPVCGWEDYEALDKITMENRLREIEEAKKRIREIHAKNHKITGERESQNPAADAEHSEPVVSETAKPKPKSAGNEVSNQLSAEKKSPQRNIISIVSTMLLISLLGFGVCIVLSGILQGFVLLFS